MTSILSQESELFIKVHLSTYMGFLGGASGEELACQCRRPKRYWFDPWVGNISWRKFTGEIPWTEEPGRLQFIWLQRVRHDQSDLACTHIHLYIY